MSDESLKSGRKFILFVGALISLSFIFLVGVLYARWMISAYPEFLVRWFGPDMLGVNLPKFLRIASWILFALSGSGVVLFVRLLSRAPAREPSRNAVPPESERSMGHGNPPP